MRKRNQYLLFKSSIPPDLCTEVLEAFGLSGVHDSQFMTMSDLRYRGTLPKMQALFDRIRPQYYSCRAIKGVETLPNAVTVLSHIVRTMSNDIYDVKRDQKRGRFPHNRQTLYCVCPRKARGLRIISPVIV
jgi:hypothetical protein